MDEFGLIERYFKPLTKGRREAGNLQDDAAVLKVPAGYELVVTSDTSNAGIHFPVDAAAADIARKALCVNLSDLAAMGADPYAYQLNIAFPEKPDEKWLEAFTNALAEDQKAFGIFCSGGDTTSINGPLSISITAMGLVPEGKAVRRNGAKSGDRIVLTGPVGDAFLGLQVLEERLQSVHEEYFEARYFRPQPRLDFVPTMRTHAHAAIDVSDGLVADLEHICTASGLEAVVDLEKIPFSKAASELVRENKVSYEALLTGGDDYELILAVPEDRLGHFPQAHVIGYFQAGSSGVKMRDLQGKEMVLARKGWRHF